MRDHNLPGWYSWLVVVGFNLASSALVLIVCLSVVQRSIEADRASRAASRDATCAVVVLQDNAFQDPASPPQTPAGKRAAEAWHNLRIVLRCDQQK